MTGIRTPEGRLVLPAVETLTSSWHEARRTRVGGSEVAALLKLSPWASWFTVWHGKKGNWSQADLMRMRWGRRLESAVVDEFSDLHPEYLTRRVGTYVHEERDWQLCTPDALLCEPGSRVAVAGLEAKASGDPWAWGEPGTDEVPVYYRCQALWSMDVTGLDRWHVAVALGMDSYAEYVLEMDDEARADLVLMREVAQRFLADLFYDVQPDIDEHTATFRAIREMHPDIDTTINAQVSDELRDEWWAAYDGEKTAVEEKRRLASLLLNEIGDGKTAYTADGQRVAYRSRTGGDAPPHLRDGRPRKTKKTIRDEAA